MGISTEKPSRQELIFLSILIMLLALFTSRILLSSGIILFLALTCIHKNLKQQLKDFISNPLLLALVLLFLLPFISGLWSIDKHMWARFVRIKLPLLLLPFGFAGNWQLTGRQWRYIAFAFLFLVFAGCCWSLWHYFQDVKVMQEAYLRAKSLPTPLGNDHIRFSLLVCIAVICIALLSKENKKFRIPASALAAFFIIYLHILAARTGLIAFYFFLILSIFYLLIHLKKTSWIVLLASSLVILPVAAWYLLPTFSNRIRYMIYDFSYMNKNVYLPGSNDGNRMLSLKAGWNILKEHPMGVGSGDIIPQTYAWYAAHIPGMLPSDQYYPSSEWLMYGGVAGWPGILMFTAVMLIPLFQKRMSDRFFWFSLNAIASFSFLFDIGLEVQFGVFIYAFTILWWWKWLHRKKAGLP